MFHRRSELRGFAMDYPWMDRSYTWVTVSPVLAAMVAPPNSYASPVLFSEMKPPWSNAEIFSCVFQDIFPMVTM